MIDEGAVGDTWIPFSQAVIVVIQPKHTARLKTTVFSHSSVSKTAGKDELSSNEPFNHANGVKMCRFCRSSIRQSTSSTGQGTQEVHTWP